MCKTKKKKRISTIKFHLSKRLQKPEFKPVKLMVLLTQKMMNDFPTLPQTSRYFLALVESSLAENNLDKF